MCAKVKQEAQQPLILRSHRLMEAFAKSDDERDFYIDRLEGFLIYADLDKPEQDLQLLEDALSKEQERFCLIPKLSFYETKKIMEGFVNEKVYDIDTKEKLLDIIQSKEARDNFLEFLYDHHAEQEKWQLFYQERSRIRIVEWLRANHFHFVFEEDLDLPKPTVEKLKQALFQTKIGKDIQASRKTLITKAKTYYSNEALNPRPKRGRPPKQVVKADTEPQFTVDVYTTAPPSIRPFIFAPEVRPLSAFSAFSSKFENEADLIASRRSQMGEDDASLQQKLSSLRHLASSWWSRASETKDDLEDDEEVKETKKPVKKAKAAAPAAPKSKAPAKKKAPPPKKAVAKAAPTKAKRPMRKITRTR